MQLISDLTLRIRTAVARALADRLLRNMGWLGGAQISGRVLRLASNVLVARLLLPESFGQAALVLALHELVGVLTRRATSGYLVQVAAPKLEAAANSAYWLNWLLGGAAFAVQAALALPLARAFDDPGLTAPLLVLAVSHLLLPMGMVHSALCVRENRLHVIALVDVLQMLADALLTLALAIAGCGVWALVLPKLLVVPVWVAVSRRCHGWRPPSRPVLRAWRAVTAFGRHLVAIDLLAAVRANVDYLIVGQLLGVEALGVYFFAYNAGLGISLSLVGAFAGAVYPDLCAARADAERLGRRFVAGVRTAALVAVPLVVLQALLAPLYVPLVYGERWVEAGALPVLMLLCLSALPRPFAEAASQLLLAAGRPRADLGWSVVFTGVTAVAVLAGTHGGLLGVAAALLAVNVLLSPCFTAWAVRRVLAAPSLPVFEFRTRREMSCRPSPS